MPRIPHLSEEAREIEELRRELRERKLKTHELEEVRTRLNELLHRLRDADSEFGTRAAGTAHNALSVLETSGKKLDQQKVAAHAHKVHTEIQAAHNAHALQEVEASIARTEAGLHEADGKLVKAENGVVEATAARDRAIENLDTQTAQHSVVQAAATQAEENLARTKESASKVQSASPPASGTTIDISREGHTTITVQPPASSSGLVARIMEARPEERPAIIDGMQQELRSYSDGQKQHIAALEDELKAKQGQLEIAKGGGSTFDLESEIKDLSETLGQVREDAAHGIDTRQRALQAAIDLANAAHQHEAAQAALKAAARQKEAAASQLRTEEKARQEAVSAQADLQQQRTDLANELDHHKAERDRLKNPSSSGGGAPAEPLSFQEQERQEKSHRLADKQTTDGLRNPITAAVRNKVIGGFGIAAALAVTAPLGLYVWNGFERAKATVTETTALFKEAREKELQVKATRAELYCQNHPGETVPLYRAGQESATSCKEIPAITGDPAYATMQAQKDAYDFDSSALWDLEKPWHWFNEGAVINKYQAIVADKIKGTTNLQMMGMGDVGDEMRKDVGSAFRGLKLPRAGEPPAPANSTPTGAPAEQPQKRVEPKAPDNDGSAIVVPKRDDQTRINKPAMPLRNGKAVAVAYRQQGRQFLARSNLG